MTYFVVMGTCGEYSDRQVWPSCVVTSAEIAETLVVRFQREVRALLAEWQQWDVFSEPIYPEKFRLLLDLIPDPAIRARYAEAPDAVEHELNYVRYGEWSYSYVEVPDPPRLGLPLADAKAALGIDIS